MATGDQNFKSYLSFKDEASGKFIKATDDMVNSMKKLGINVKKEGSAIAVDLDKMANAHDNLGRKTRTSDQTVTGFIRSMGSLRNMLLVYFFALRPVINLIKESSEAYQEQEDAIKRINFAMGLQGTYSKTMSDNLIKLSQSFQSVTKYGDEAVLKVMEKLITVGRIMPSQIERATQATLDFAAATGKDLGTASDIMAKAASGYTAQLSRYGIIIDKNIPATQKFSEVLKFVETRMGGRSQADIKSFSGALAQASNNMNDLKESIGFLINRGLNLPVVVGYWSQAFKNLNDSISGVNVTNIDILQKRLEEVRKKISASGATEIAKQKPTAFHLIMGGYSESEIKRAQNLLLEQENLVQSIKMEYRQRANIKITEDEKANEVKISQEKLAIREQWEETYSSFQRTKAKFRLQELNKEVATYRSAFKDSAEELLEIDTWYNTQKAILTKQAFEEGKKDVIGNAKLWVDVTRATANAMKDALADGFFKIVRGEFDGLMDVVNNFGNVVLQALMQALAVKAMIGIGLGGFLGLAHSGGYMLGAGSFGNVRKFKTGGIAGDEIPAILHRNEGVINERGMGSLGVDNLNRLNRGESMGGGDITNNYFIQAIDVKSFRDRLEQHGDIYSNASAANVRNNGTLRKTNQKYII